MSPEDPDTAAIVGTVAWTAEGRKAMREKSGLLHGLFAEEEVAACLGMRLRAFRKFARANGIGWKIGRTQWLTEAELLALKAEDTCSSSQNVTAQTSTPAGRSSRSQLKEALELATEGKPKSSSPSCKVKSSRGTSVVPFPPALSIGEQAASRRQI
jgi:hypothetical protein